MFRKIITLFVVVTMVAIGLIGVVPRTTQVARAAAFEDGGMPWLPSGGDPVAIGGVGGGGGGVIDPSPVAEGTGEEWRVFNKQLGRVSQRTEAFRAISCGKWRRVSKCPECCLLSKSCYPSS